MWAATEARAAGWGGIAGVAKATVGGTPVATSCVGAITALYPGG